MGSWISFSRIILQALIYEINAIMAQTKIWINLILTSIDFWIISFFDVPLNGQLPVSSSYIVTPSDHISALKSWLLQVITSGAIYIGVPNEECNCSIGYSYLPNPKSPNFTCKHPCWIFTALANSSSIVKDEVSIFQLSKIFEGLMSLWIIRLSSWRY